jgi:hypothetical protein
MTDKQYTFSTQMMVTYEHTISKNLFDLLVHCNLIQTRLEETAHGKIWICDIGVKQIPNLRIVLKATDYFQDLDYAEEICELINYLEDIDEQNGKNIELTYIGEY